MDEDIAEESLEPIPTSPHKARVYLPVRILKAANWGLGAPILTILALLVVIYIENQAAPLSSESTGARQNYADGCLEFPLTHYPRLAVGLCARNRTLICLNTCEPNAGKILLHLNRTKTVQLLFMLSHCFYDSECTTASNRKYGFNYQEGINYRETIGQQTGRMCKIYIHNQQLKNISLCADERNRILKLLIGETIELNSRDILLLYVTLDYYFG